MEGSPHQTVNTFDPQPVQLSPAVIPNEQTMTYQGDVIFAPIHPPASKQMFNTKERFADSEIISQLIAEPEDTNQKGKILIRSYKI